MGRWHDGTTGQSMKKRSVALSSMFALCAALLSPGFTLGQAVRAASAPNPPTNLHVTSITVDTVNGGWEANFAWTPPDATSEIAATNGPGGVVPLGVAASTYFVVLLVPGVWGCLSVVAYNASSASSWTPYVCAEAPGIPPMVNGVHLTPATTTTVPFAWYWQYPFTGIAVSDGNVVTALSGGATTYAATVAPGYWACLSVVAYDAAGASPWTPWVCGFAVPITPSGLHVTGHTPSSVSFAWTDHDPYSSILVTDGNAFVGNSLAQTTYTKSGMTAGTQACISVLAYNSYNPGEPNQGISPWSPLVCGQAG